MNNTTGLIILILIILLQLKERELKVQRMWIAPVLIAYYTFTHVFNQRDLTLLEMGLFVLLLILGGIVGAVRASTTTVRIDKNNRKIYAKSSYFTLGIWIVVFILRFIVTYIFKGSSQHALDLVTNGIFCFIAADECIRRIILYVKAKNLMHSEN